MLTIALASQSPRRLELLQKAGFFVRTFPVKVSEIFDKNLTPEQVVSHLATVKLRAAVNQHNDLKSQGFLILTGDTVVVLGERILGKPENSQQAAGYLRLLSGKTHRVISGVALAESGRGDHWVGVDETVVEFRQLSGAEISEYVASGEPFDKAGAYAIQGNGGRFVSSIKGSWSNVVGLPLELLERALKENHWDVSRRTSAQNS